MPHDSDQLGVQFRAKAKGVKLGRAALPETKAETKVMAQASDRVRQAAGEATQPPLSGRLFSNRRVRSRRLLAVEPVLFLGQCSPGRFHAFKALEGRFILRTLSKLGAVLGIFSEMV
jgi:hypothetical protein